MSGLDDAGVVSMVGVLGFGASAAGGAAAGVVIGSLITIWGGAVAAMLDELKVYA